MVENARKLPANISIEFEQDKLDSTSSAATLQTTDLGSLQMDVLDEYARASEPIDTPMPLFRHKSRRFHDKIGE